MLCFDAFAARKVRDGAAHLQHPVVSAGGKAHALKGAAQHTVGVFGGVGTGTARFYPAQETKSVG